MTLTIDLKPEVEARAKAEAKVHGVAVEEFLSSVIESALNAEEKPFYETASLEEDMSRKVVESTALEGYRSGELTSYQVMRLLVFESRMEVDAFLKRHKLYDYTLGDIDRDAEASRLASSRHRDDY